MCVNNYKGLIKINQVKNLEMLEKMYDDFNKNLFELDNHLSNFLIHFRKNHALLHLFGFIMKSGIEDAKKAESNGEEISKEYLEMMYLLIHKSDGMRNYLENNAIFDESHAIFHSFQELPESNLFLANKLEEHKDGVELVKLFSQRGIFSDLSMNEVVLQTLKSYLEEIVTNVLSDVFKSKEKEEINPDL